MNKVLYRTQPPLVLFLLGKNIHIFKKSPPPIHKLATQTHPTRYCGFINFLLLTATRSVAQVFCRSWTWTSDGIRTVQESRPHQDSSMAGALCVWATVWRIIKNNDKSWLGPSLSWRFGFFQSFSTHKVTRAENFAFSLKQIQIAPPLLASVSYRLLSLSSLWRRSARFSIFSRSSRNWRSVSLSLFVFPLDALQLELLRYGWW